MVRDDVFIEEIAFGFGAFEFLGIFVGHVVVPVCASAVEGDFEGFGFRVVDEGQDR